MTTTVKRKKAANPKDSMSAKAEQRALVDSFHASMPDLKLSVDAYLREKYAETEAENGK